VSKKIIRVIETRVYEYSPYDEGTDVLMSWYTEDGRNATTIAEAMEIDREIMQDHDNDNWAPLDDFATHKSSQTTYSFNLVTVPDNYDPKLDEQPEWDEI